MIFQSNFGKKLKKILGWYFCITGIDDQGLYVSDAKKWRHLKKMLILLRLNFRFLEYFAK